MHEKLPFLRGSQGLGTEVLAVDGYPNARRCTRLVDTCFVVAPKRGESGRKREALLCV